jgi:anti-sigma regulatory factor (Ser/Thr protein kinase)
VRTGSGDVISHIHVLSSVPRDEHDVKLSLPALAANVAVVRHVLGAFAEAQHLPDRLVEDMRLAVTEACTNVVRHAYQDRRVGAMEVLLSPRPDGVEVVVGDDGRGIGPSPDTAGPGLGLPLIAAIADSLQIQHAPGHGSRIVMTFGRPGPESA